MNDQDKTREQLIEELAAFRGRVTGLEAQLARSQQAEEGITDRKRAEEDVAIFHEIIAPIREGEQILGILGVNVDISDRKQTEAALRKSERRLNTVISNLPGAVYRCKADANWTVEYLSDGYLPLTGYEPSQLIGQPGSGHSELIHPDDRQRELDALQMAINQRQHYQIEYRLRTATGEEKWVYEQGTAVFSESGELEAIEGFTTDITRLKRAENELQQANDRLEQRVVERTTELRKANELLQREVEQRRQADEALRQSEAKYRALVESCPDAVAMMDLQGRIVFASQRAAEQQGALDPDELLGTLAEDLVIESERDRFRYGSRLLCEQGVRRDDQYTGLRKDGATFAAELSSAVIRDTAGNPVGLMGVYRDITERKRTEEELAILGRFAEAATQGFGMMDLDGRIIYLNPMMARLLGEKEPQEALGKHVSTYHSSEYSRKRDETIRPALRQAGHWQGELPLVRRDGTVVPTLHTIFSVRDKNGEIFRLAAVVTDITELKRAEEALGQSHGELRAIYDGMPDGLLVADIETKKFVRCNASMRRMLGYCEEELLSRSVTDIHPVHEVSKVLEAFHSLVEDRQRIAEDIPVLRKDGTVFHADVTHHEITLNGQRCTVGFFRDIQERRLAQEELQQSYHQLQASKERYELAVRGAGVGIWDWDLTTGKVYYSPRWKMLFGYEQHEIGDGFEDWGRLLHPDERESIIKLQEGFLADTSLAVVTAEYRLRHKDGSYRWIMAHAVVVRNDQGKAVRMVGSHGDITDRKLAEEKVKAEQRALRQMVLATDHERRLITYELHDGVAQQLLGAMMHFQAVEPPKDQKSRTADIYRGGLAALRQAASEIRRVMNWLRTPVLEEFGLVAGIDDVASQLRSAPQAPEIEYRHAVHFERLEPTLENTLFRIAQEAMTNACRHSQSGKVRVTLTQEGDEVTLEVRDWGIGFDQDVVVENHYGLQGIRERSEIQGGRLTITSTPGQGTVIAVTLPVIEAADPGETGGGRPTRRVR